MFMTTNRISVIDTAFKSRIDLILPFYGLDESSRRSVWANFIRHLGSDSANVGDSELDVLAREEMNGREIKNTIKTAMVLAKRKAEPLQLAHLRVVLDIRKRLATFERLDEEAKAAKYMGRYTNGVAT